MKGLNIDGYRARMKAYKQGTSVGKVSAMQKRLIDSFYKTPSFHEVLINNEIREVHIVQGYQGESNLLTKPGEKIEVGNLVKWQDNFYLCSLVENNKTVNYKGILKKCNGILKWQDANGFIYEEPCILIDKTSVYSDGLSKTQYMWMGTDQISATVQTNINTKKISSNKRFIFKNDKNNIYEITRSDDMLNEGLSTFVCKKSLYNSLTDRLDLNLANYKDTNTDIVEHPSDSLIINGNDRLTIWDVDVPYSVNTEKDVMWTLDNDKVLSIKDDIKNTCLISPISTVKIGKATLRVELTDDNTQYAEKVISLYYQ